MKEIMAEQAKRNREEFESLPPEQRQDYIGVQPGAYVRLEIPVSKINQPILQYGRFFQG